MANKNFVVRNGFEVAPNSAGIGTYLTVNGTSGSVGIGTTNPQVALQLGTGGAIRVYRSDNTRYGSIYADSTGLQVESSSAGDNLYLTALGTSAGTSVIVEVSGSERARINQTGLLIGAATSTGTSSQPLQVTGGAYFNGSVGIGTTNPLGKLQVSGGGIFLDNNTSAQSNLSSNYIGFGTNNVARITGRDNDTSSGFLAFIVQNEKVRIDNNGSVGIGTTNPIEEVHLFNSQNSGTVVRVENPNTGSAANASFRAFADVANVNLNVYTSTRATTGYGITQPSFGELSLITGNGFQIGTKNATPLILGTNDTEALRIDSSQRVGIGTTNPLGRLQVGTATTQTFVISSTGNVGLGTTNPTSRLTVLGKALFTNYYSNNVPTVVAITTDNSVRFDETEPRDIYMVPDGKSLYILGNTGNDITQYRVYKNGTYPYDVSGIGTPGISTSSVYNLNPWNLITVPTGFTFTPDGYKLFIIGTGISSVSPYGTNPQIGIGSTGILKYSLYNPWEIDNIDVDTSKSGEFYSSYKFALGTYTNSPQAIEFSTDGKKFYVLSATSPATIFEFSTGDPWNFVDCALTSQLNISAQDTSPQGMTFSKDGTKLLVAGDQNNRVYSYRLTTPWSIASAIYTGVVFTTGSGGIPVEGNPSGIFLNSAADTLFTVGYDQDKIVGYAISGFSESDVEISGPLNVYSKSRFYAPPTMYGGAQIGTLEFGSNGEIYNNSEIFSVDGSTEIYLGSGAGAFLRQNRYSSGSTSFHNILIGVNAGYNVTQGSNNVFVGYAAGSSTTIGGDNVFLGFQSGYGNTSGNFNNFIGRLAGFCNTTGVSNNFFGNQAGLCNTTGSYNNFFGSLAGCANTSGYGNNFFGDSAGLYNTIGCNNLFMGGASGSSNISGNYNNFLGYLSGNQNNSGSHNNFIGNSAGSQNTTGSHNNFFGCDAGFSNTTACHSIMIGTRAGYYNNSNGNIFLGFCAGYGNTTTSTCNIYIGYQAGQGPIGGNTSTTTDNILIGRSAGQCINGGDNNVSVGVAAGCCITTGSNNVMVGNSAGAKNTTGTCNVFLGYIAGCTNTCGVNNIAQGTCAACSITTGCNNVIIGSAAGISMATVSNNSFFGTNAGRLSTGGCNTFLGACAGCSVTTGTNNVAIGAGINVASATGNCQLAIGAGTTTWISGDSTGKVTIPTPITSTSTTTGALVVSGGVGIAGALYVGGGSFTDYSAITAATQVTSGAASTVTVSAGSYLAFSLPAGATAHTVNISGAVAQTNVKLFITNGTSARNVTFAVAGVTIPAAQVSTGSAVANGGSWGVSAKYLVDITFMGGSAAANAYTTLT